MPIFSQHSLTELATSEPKLQRLAWLTIQYVDFRVLEGHRGQERQEELFKAGTTLVHWPDSEHNAKPSRALDFVPYPTDWNDIDAFRRVGECFKAAAILLGIQIVWGGEWTSFKDWGHIELAEGE